MKLSLERKSVIEKGERRKEREKGKWQIDEGVIQGDQIGRLFCQIGYFWMLIMILWKDDVAQRIGIWLHFWLLLAQENLLHFHIYRQFQCMVCWHFRA